MDINHTSEIWEILVYYSINKYNKITYKGNALIICEGIIWPKDTTTPKSYGRQSSGTMGHLYKRNLFCSAYCLTQLAGLLNEVTTPKFSF